MQSDSSLYKNDPRDLNARVASEDALLARAELLPPRAAGAPEADFGSVASISLDILKVVDGVYPMARQLGVDIATEPPRADHVISPDDEVSSALKHLIESAICFGSGAITIRAMVDTQNAMSQSVYAQIQLSRSELNLPSHTRAKLSALLCRLKGETTFRSAPAEDSVTISFPLVRAPIH